MIVSIISAILWVLALNCMVSGMLFAYKKIMGGALLFTVGMACLMLVFGVGVRCHIDIAKTFGFATIGSPVIFLWVFKRLKSAKPI